MSQPRVDGHNFTQRARKVLEIPHGLARQMGHDVAPAHMALGMIREGNGVATTALRYKGVALAAVERELEKNLPAASPAQDREVSWTVAAEEVIQHAGAESRELGHRYVGTEHLLLALVGDSSGMPAQVLARHGVGIEETRARVLWVLGSDLQHPEPFVWPPAV